MTSTMETPGIQRLQELDANGRSLMFLDARTANTFDATPVSDAKLTEIWDLAKWAPSAANLQPLRVLFVRSDEGRERLAAHMSDTNQAKTRSAPVVAVLAADTRYHEHIPTVLPFRPELKDVFEANDELRTSTGEFNVALQVGYFILAVRSVGLAAGPMAGFDAASIDADFFPDARWHSVLVVNIGHPGEEAWMQRLPRLDHAEVIRWA